MEPDRRYSSNVERHIQTIGIALCTGAIMFAANYFFVDTSAKAKGNAELALLTSQVIELRGDIRAMQVTQGNYVRREEHQAHDVMLRKHSEDIAVLKSRMTRSEARP